MITGEIRAGANSVTVYVKGLEPKTPIEFGITSVAKMPVNASTDQRVFLSSAFPVDENGELRFGMNTPTMLPDLPRYVVAHVGTNIWTIVVEHL